MKQMKFTNRFVCMLSVVILILMLMSAHLTAAGVTSIKIFSKAEVEKDDIFLGEIGKITCEDQDLLSFLVDGTADFTKSLKLTALFFFKPPGSQVLVRMIADLFEFHE